MTFIGRSSGVWQEGARLPRPLVVQRFASLTVVSLRVVRTRAHGLSGRGMLPTTLSMQVAFAPEKTPVGSTFLGTRLCSEEQLLGDPGSHTLL